MNVNRATPLDNHHLFGFHDLVAFNLSNDKLLSLQVTDISRPPLPNESAKVGYCHWQEQRFVELGETVAFNYPQGARQQWLSDSLFMVNNRVGAGWGSDLYDVSNGKKLDSYSCTSHCVTKDGNFAFGIDYSRIHRLGGYGYIGIDDSTENEDTPSKAGIWKLNLKSKQYELLVNLHDVARCDEKTSAINGLHHYVTHLVLSPNNERIAFLHRFVLADGGIRTRLMTIGVDGANLRCLAAGFLSHFDWKDDSSLLIWGRSGGGVDKMRSNPLLNSPLLKPALNISKKVVRKLLSSTTSALSMSFLLVSDSDTPTVTSTAQGILTEDGHPMFSPTNREVIVTDNYPDPNGVRTLMLYDFVTCQRTDLGTFKMLDDKPNTSLISEYTKGVSPKVLSLISPELFSFTRSGLHCDLHPRWNSDGTIVAFDSIHEGSRQIYTVDVRDYLK